MPIEEKRMAVASLYPGAGWKNRVLKMSDAQICAIYKKHFEKQII